MSMRYTLKTIITFTILLVAAAGLSACDSLTDGYDQDPNQATEARGDLLFNGASTTLIMFHEGNLARFSSIFTNQSTGSDRQYARVNRYEVNSSDIDSDWSTGYADVLGDLNTAKTQARATGQTLLLNFSRVLEAHTFGQMAALFGDIPFTAAFQGSGELNPEFVAQAEVYSSLQDSLDLAIEELEAYQDLGDGAPGPDLVFGDTSLDIYYGGDVESWIQLAYTLKGRLHLHTAEYASALQAIQDGGMDGASRNLIAPHEGSFNVNANLWWSFINVYRGGYLTANEAYAPSLLNPASDLYRGNTKTDDSDRFGFYYTGSDPAYSLNTGGGAAFGAASAYPLLRYAESELIRAEAILQSDGDTQDAIDALNRARDANATYYGGSYADYELADFQAGGISEDVPNGVTQTAENALLTEILEEKYLSTVGSIEAFNDFRRTDNFLQIPLKEGETAPVGRLPYAAIELQANESAPEQSSVTSETPVNGSFSYSAID